MGLCDERHGDCLMGVWVSGERWGDAVRVKVGAVMSLLNEMGVQMYGSVVILDCRPSGYACTFAQLSHTPFLPSPLYPPHTPRPSPQLFRPIASLVSLPRWSGKMTRYKT